MDGDAETKRNNIEQNRSEVRYHAEFRQRDDNHGGAEQSIDDAVESELFRRDRELTIDR
jgi:hypothetical protein